MRVLIADDSKAMRMIVLRTLRQSGLQIDDVFEAEDGAIALAAVSTFAPDLIMSDWSMPNMTGIEFLTNLRAAGNLTTFGFVTAETNSAMREQAIAGGAAFFIRKPVDVDRVAEVVGALVS